jgi:hypothetical protein
MSNLAEPVELIEGIGEAHGAKLRAKGADRIGDLLKHSTAWIARATGVGEDQAEKWVAAGWLLQVSEVEPDIAEALVQAGVRSIVDLADAGLETLEQAMQKAVAANTTNTASSVYRLAEIQRNAGRQRNTGVVFGKLTWLDTAEPVVNANVIIAGQARILMNKVVLRWLVSAQAKIDCAYTLMGLSQQRHELMCLLTGLQSPVESSWEETHS